MCFQFLLYMKVMSREEWNYLKQQHLPDLTDNATEQQRTFLELIMGAAKRLFNYMEISNEDAASHRLYDAEIIDLTEDVSFIVICPPAEFSCLVPGKKIDHNTKRLQIPKPSIPFRPERNAPPKRGSAEPSRPGVRDDTPQHLPDQHHT